MADNTWDEQAAAPEFYNLPVDDYQCSVVSIEPHTAKTGAVGHKIVFRVEEGKYAGKHAPAHFIWHEGSKISPDMVSNAKRSLSYLGFKSFKEVPALPTGRFNVTINRELSGVAKVVMFTPFI